MEILFAVLLLFGAFTLGSTTTTGVDADVRAGVPAADGRSIPAPENGRQARLESMLCRSTQVTVYRDLTEPYAGPRDQSAAHVSDDKDGCRHE